MNMIRTLATATALVVGAAATAPAQTLDFAYDADPVSLDPHEQLSGGTLQLSHMIFDPLVRWNRDLDFDARLAESWERIDETTMRFHLRDGVTFHSGNEMTAEDVVWTIERLKSSPDFKGIFAGWTSAEAIDADTVEIKTDGASPLVLHTATYVFPMDKDFYEEGGAEIAKHGDSFASRNVSGTGPFIITEREQGVRVLFERNPDYWDEESPGNVQTAILRPIKEAPDARRGPSVGRCGLHRTGAAHRSRADPQRRRHQAGDDDRHPHHHAADESGAQRGASPTPRCVRPWRMPSTTRASSKRS